MNQKYQISGMTCNGCRTNVEDKLNEIPGVKATVTLDPPEVIIDSEDRVDVDECNKALSEIGDYHIVQNNSHHNGKKSVYHKADDQSKKKCSSCFRQIHLPNVL